MVAVALYLHRMIKKYDEGALCDAFRAADVAALGQTRYLGSGDESGRESISSNEGDEEKAVGSRSRAVTGGLDTDVWQGGKRVKRRGFTPTDDEGGKTSL